jgi:hypothetical protein
MKDFYEVLILIIGIAALSIVVGNSTGFATDVGSLGSVYDNALSTAASAGADVQGGNSGSGGNWGMSDLTGSGFGIMG